MSQSAYEPLTLRQWLFLTATLLALGWFAVSVLGASWANVLPGMCAIAISGWVSYAAYLQRIGRPMFSWGNRSRSVPGQPAKPQPRSPRSLPKSTGNLNARLSKGQGRMPSNRAPSPPPRTEIPDSVPVKAPPPPRPAWARSPAPIPSSESIPVRLLMQLDDLTHDRAVSERLVWQAQSRYPDQSVIWCAEKAIWDLERDRF